ncbi:MAG: glycosyltransferase [Saccharolobus sp.]
MKLDILLYLLISILVSISTILYITFTLPLAFTYKPKTTQSSVNKKDITVLIPVYKEDKKIFRDVINSVKKQGLKIIVVGDGCEEPYKKITESSGGLFIKLPRNMGKRRAIREGFKYVKTPYVLLLDSDTILPENAVEILASKLNDQIVAVSPEVSVIRGKSKVAYSVAEMMQRLREISYRALARFGSIVSLNGQCILAKSEVIRPLIESEEFDSVRLWKFRTILGDDRQITNYIYQKGFKAMVVRDVVVKTKAPDNLNGLLKQLIRWYRSNNFFLIKELTDGTLFKKGFFYMFTILYWYTLPLLTLANYSLYTEIILRNIVTHWNIFVRIITKDPVRFIEYMIVRKIDNVLNINLLPKDHKFDKIVTPIHHIIPHKLYLFPNGQMGIGIDFFHYFYIFHNLIGEVSSIASIIMILSILVYTRKSVREFVSGLLAFPLMFVADVFALLTIWKQNKWLGRS